MTDGTTSAEAELAIEHLLDKLQKWLLQQPEVTLLWAQDRFVRRRLAELIAHELVTIPVRDPTDEPNRAQRKAIIHELYRGSKEWFKGIEV